MRWTHCEHPMLHRCILTKEICMNLWQVLKERRYWMCCCHRTTMITNEIALFTTFEMRIVLFMLICLQHHHVFYPRSYRCRQTILLLPRIGHQQCVIPREVAGNATIPKVASVWSIAMHSTTESPALLFLLVNQRIFIVFRVHIENLVKEKRSTLLWERMAKTTAVSAQKGLIPKTTKNRTALLNNDTWCRHLTVHLALSVKHIIASLINVVVAVEFDC
mmetsp:Transcript_10355/g.30284  ORF Transcript_10355/g.30284 Transcript_10355/m.30284 type:complete len:219 (-) Transcript_10355:336-992(-)